MAKFVELVLTALQFQTEGLLEIADIFSHEPGGRRKSLHVPMYERQWFKKSWADMYRDRQQFYRTLNYLKCQGLVVKKKEKDGSAWILTPSGKARVQKYRKSRRDPFSTSQATFRKPEGGGITIVTYDVPEKERRKRDWIRRCLMEMDCEKIQKSVWVAKGAIDENFIHALRQRNLLPNVHVFAVTKQGTVNQITK
ncbi:MAG: hypothetical protein HY617_03695 [Candidatus Sungbacteria bacterium]|nr:hypothetical protein [Candidatus Sungbacteria bacterium]